MESTTLYATALASAFALWILFRILVRLFHLAKLLLAVLVVKHLIYPYLYRRRHMVGVTTRFQVLAVMLFITGNVFSLATGVKSTTQVGSRAGTLAVVNLLGLLVSPRFSLLADSLGISSRSFVQIHRWIGRITMIHTIIHVLSIVIERNPANRLDTAAVTVSKHHLNERMN